MAGPTSRRRWRPARVAAAMVTALGASWLGVGTLDAATAGPAGASGSAFHLVPGPTLGALGSFGINFRAIPNGPADTARPPSRPRRPLPSRGRQARQREQRPPDVDLHRDFLTNRLGPLFGWLWSPHCADPANVPYTFTATSAAGGVAGVPLPPLSCSQQGGPGLHRISLTPSPSPRTRTAWPGSPGRRGISGIRPSLWRGPSTASATPPSSTLRPAMRDRRYRQRRRWTQQLAGGGRRWGVLLRQRPVLRLNGRHPAPLPRGRHGLHTRPRRVLAGGRRRRDLQLR